MHPNPFDASIPSHRHHRHRRRRRRYSSNRTVARRPWPWQRQWRSLCRWQWRVFRVRVPHSIAFAVRNRSCRVAAGRRVVRRRVRPRDRMWMRTAHSTHNRLCDHQSRSSYRSVAATDVSRRVRSPPIAIYSISLHTAIQTDDEFRQSEGTCKGGRTYRHSVQIVCFAAIVIAAVRTVLNRCP